MTNPTVWHCLSFRDAVAGIEFLKALGCVERLIVRDESDSRVIQHAEFTFGDHGGIMCGSAQRGTEAGSDWERRVGVGSCYLVVDSDAEVDATHQRALAAGGTSIQDPVSVDYGGRSAGVQDAEGNQYSIGSYRGA